MVESKDSQLSIEELINELERNQKNNEKVSLGDIEELENMLFESDSISGPVEYFLRNKLYNLKRYALSVEMNKRVTKWELFRNDISHLKGEKFDKLKSLVEIIDENKDATIDEDLLSEIEKSFEGLSYFIHHEFNEFDRDRILNEISKRIKLFRNRTIRIIKNNDFADYLKNLRQEKGYSLRELEQVSGVTASYIHRLETGERKTPSVPIAEKLADGLGVDRNIFFEKLEILNPEAPISLIESLKNRPYLVGDKELKLDTQSVLADIIQTVLECEWSVESRLPDTLKITSLIDKLKSLND